MTASGPSSSAFKQCEPSFEPLEAVAEDVIRAAAFLDDEPPWLVSTIAAGSPRRSVRQWLSHSPLSLHQHAEGIAFRAVIRASKLDASRFRGEFHGIEPSVVDVQPMLDRCSSMGLNKSLNQCDQSFNVKG